MATQAKLILMPYLAIRHPSRFPIPGRRNSRGCRPGKWPGIWCSCVARGGSPEWLRLRFDRHFVALWTNPTLPPP